MVEKDARQSRATVNKGGIRRSSVIDSKNRHSSAVVGKKGAPRPSRVSGKTGRSDQHGGPTQVTVTDENGADVTPKPLLTLKPTVSGKGASQATPGHSTPTSEVSEAVVERMSSAGFSRSGYSEHGSMGSMSPVHMGMEGDDGSTPRGEEMSEDEGGGGEPHLKAAAEAMEASREHKVLTEELLDKNVTLNLQETETFWLLHLPGRCVAMDSAEATVVEEANERYRVQLKQREGSELFVESGMQTLNPLCKQKEVQVSLHARVSNGCQATAHDIADSMEVPEDGPDAASVDVIGQSASAPTADKTGTAVDAAAAAAAAAAAESKKEEAASAAETEALEKLPGIEEALAYVEKVVVQNVYHDKLLIYRNFKTRGAENAALGALAEDATPAPPASSNTSQAPEQAMLPLWEFKSSVTAGRNVSTMAWNKARKDLLAVGYGEFDFLKQKEGMVAFWSLKNPEHPERTFTTQFGVTALDFSAMNPNLLAVGLYDGTVSVYDVRAPTDKPVLESGHTGGKHSDPVWKLRWVQSGSEQSESLVSISTDGRVTQWSIKKGLEFMDLMKLKRVARARGGGKQEAFISRRSSGMCLDFCPRDSSVYLAGTEDGHIHKCSCSYSEQYLDSYFAHAGPVYSIAWSPYVHNLFLSASSDWTIKLWQEERESPLLTFQSGNEDVTDMCWSPSNSTVFGSVTADGRVEVWDISTNTLKPVLSQTTDAKLSCLLFSEASPVLVCGGDTGSVHVYRLVGVDKSEDTAETQAARLEEAMSSNSTEALASES
mmetsp:Transcript_24966/g.81789  ORF Transcript_24966/g.81789 Transcript_24966/m.81789 type:complete len:774 (+) Transcript_24966:69-2390(+)